jgi:hypothetical protein
MAWFVLSFLQQTLILIIVQWPYSYDSCDVGTLPNQTYPGTQTPLAAVQNGDPSNGGVLVSVWSYSFAADIHPHCNVVIPSRSTFVYACSSPMV